MNCNSFHDVLKVRARSSEKVFHDMNSEQEVKKQVPPGPEKKKTAKRKKRRKKIGRPFAPLFYLAYPFVSLYYRIKYRVKVDRSATKGRRGPAIVLAPHVSAKDPYLTAMALFPARATYVMSEHFITGKAMRAVCRIMHAVTKKMFCPDTGAVLNMIRAAREGNTIVIFPEGRLTWYGRSLEVTEGTAELVKQLGIDVLTVTSYGAGMTFPKWAPKPRRGRILVKSEKLLDASEVREMTVAEIDEKIRAALRHDAENAMPGVRFRTKDTTLGLDGIIWKCPKCGEDYSLDCSGGHVRCRECGLDAVLDEYGRFSGPGELAAAGISTVADWYEYCASTLDIDRPLVLSVALSATGGDLYMKNDVGMGILTVTKDAISFEGELDGRPDSFSVPTSRVAAFPITVADHIDIYRDGRLILAAPIPDKRKAILPVAYLDRVTALRRSRERQEKQQRPDKQEKEE